MSVKVSAAVWGTERFEDLRGNEMLVMLALADIANDDGHVVFAKGENRTQAALAKKARVSVATFRRATQELERRGLLTISRESHRTENEYRILVTAQSERSQMSGQTVQDERSERSLVSGHSSYRRSDVADVAEGAAPKRGTRIPDPFLVTREMREWAASEVPLVAVDLSTRMFVDHWRAATRNATKRDWIAAWRNWLRKDQQEAVRRGGPRRSTIEVARSADEILRDREREASLQPELPLAVTA